MEPLIHKAALAVLDFNPDATNVSPGDHVDLKLEADGLLSVHVSRPSRLPFGLGKPSRQRVGMLGQRESDLLAPALAVQAHLRVRVVEVEPAYLSPKGENVVCISVWGDRSHLESSTQRRHTIFSSSRINEPVSSDKPS